MLCWLSLKVHGERSLTDCKRSDTFVTDHDVRLLLTLRFVNGRASNGVCTFYNYHLPLGSMGDGFQNLSPIPQSTDAQVPYVKWLSICI